MPLSELQRAAGAACYTACCAQMPLRGCRLLIALLTAPVLPPRCSHLQFVQYMVLYGKAVVQAGNDW